MCACGCACAWFMCMHMNQAQTTYVHVVCADAHMCAHTTCTHTYCMCVHIYCQYFCDLPTYCTYIRTYILVVEEVKGKALARYNSVMVSVMAVCEYNSTCYMRYGLQHRPCYVSRPCHVNVNQTRSLNRTAVAGSSCGVHTSLVSRLSGITTFLIAHV